MRPTAESRPDVIRDFLDPRHRLSFLWGYVARQQLLRAIQPMAHRAAGRVLDVGCGRQPYRSLFTNAQSYIGVDVSGSLHALEPGTVLFDGSHLPFPAGTFDVVFSTEVLEHATDPSALMAECARVLAPGGRMYATTPFVFPLHEVPHDFRRFTSFGLERLASDAGFTSVTISPLAGYAATVAHVLGLFAQHRLSRFYFRLWAYPLIWLLQKALLGFERLDHREAEFTIGWALEAHKPATPDARGEAPAEPSTGCVRQPGHILP